MVVATVVVTYIVQTILELDTNQFFVYQSGSDRKKFWIWYYVVTLKYIHQHSYQSWTESKHLKNSIPTDIAILIFPRLISRMLISRVFQAKAKAFSSKCSFQTQYYKMQSILHTSAMQSCKL